MTEREERVVAALARLAEQYLTNGSGLDSQSISAGEVTLAALAEHGLVTVSGDGRFASWTQAGARLLNSDDCL